MSLLKSVIADARPAKSVQRLHTPAAGAAGPMPVARATDNMPMKSSAGRADTFLGRQSQHQPMVANPSVQQSHRQSSRLIGKRDNQSIVSKRFSQAEKNNSQSPPAKVAIARQTGQQSDESVKPVSQTTRVQHSQDLSSVKFSANTKSLENQVPSTVDSVQATEKKPAVHSRKNIQDEKVKPTTYIPTPIQTQLSNASPESSVADFADMSGTDFRPVSSASNDKRIKPQDSIDTSFSEDGFKQGRVDTAGSNQKHQSASREYKPDIADQNEKPDISAELYQDSDSYNTQFRDGNSGLQSEEKYEAEMPTTETEHSGVDARLHNLELQHEQQTVKQSAAPMMAAQTTNMLADQQADLRPAINSVHINPSSPEVRIGQVDVFIDKPVAKSETTGRSFRPSISMASRHYLRRL